MNPWTAVRRRVYDIGVRAGVVSYRRPWLVRETDWDGEYASSRCDHYGSLEEICRYSAIIAYMEAKGEQMTVLDVGCGTGLLEQRSRHVAISRFVGVDPSEVAIRKAKEQAHPRSEFVVTDVSDRELGKFDVVVCNEILYYVEDLRTFLFEISLRMADGAWLVTSILKHPGDIGLRRSLSERFDVIDEVLIARQERPRNAWRIGCYRLRPSMSDSTP